MAQNYFSIVTNKGRNKLALSAAGGAAVTITHFAIGDGNGAEVNPTAASTALVREVWRTPVESVVIDPLNPSAVLITSIIPTNAGGWWMREFGIFDVDGDMIAVAKPVSQYKPTALEGQLEDIRYEFQIIIGETANVTMLVDPSVLLASRAWVESRKVPVAQLSLTPWVPVKSMTVAAPPANPAAWDTYIIPVDATGAWAGHAQKLAEWNGTGWNIITTKDGHGVSLPDGRVFERVNGIYIEKLALDAQSGKWLYGVAAGSANALTVALAPVPQALTAGLVLRIKVSTTNTAAATLNVNGLGAKPIVRIDDGGLIEGDLTAGDLIEIVYTGTQWRLLSFCRSLLPKPLTKTQIFYVRPDGNDNNNGLANTAASAFKTLFGAWGAVSSRYMPSDKYAIEFQLAPGTYEGVSFGGYSGMVKIVGSAATRSQYTIKEAVGQTYAISASNGHVILAGVTLQSVTAAGIETLLVWANGAGKITLQDTRILPPANNPALTLIYLGGGGKVDVRGSIEIFGVDGAGSAVHSVVRAEQGAVFSGGLFAYPVVWSVYNIKTSSAWVVSNSLSPQSWVGMSFSKAGSIFTGRRYYVDGNSVVETGGSGPNFFPGDIAGSVASGGQYL